MAVVVTKLSGTYDNVDRTAYTPAAVTPTANYPQYVVVITAGSAATLPTVSSTTGHSWTQDKTVTNGIRRETLFYAPSVASPANGTITADFGGVTVTGASITWLEASGVDESVGGGGVAGIVQSATTSGNTTGGTVTLAAFASASNATVAVFGHLANETNTVGTGFNSPALADFAGTTPNLSTLAEWRPDADTSADATWATSSIYVGIAWEIAAAAGGGGIVGPLIGPGRLVGHGNLIGPGRLVRG